MLIIKGSWNGLTEAVRGSANNEREALATSYLRHTAQGGLAEGELEEAETAYVLWDWDGLALLAYEQFLKRGRGVLVGPRTVIDADSITVAFDYVPNATGSIAEILSPRLAVLLRPHVDHYHPEFDFVVVWRRKDDTVRYEILRSNDKLGLRAPRDLYDRRPRPLERAARPS